MLERAGQAVVTHARTVLVVALLLGALGFAIGHDALAHMSSDTGAPGAASARATDLVERASGSGPSADDIVLIVTTPGGWPTGATGSAGANGADGNGSAGTSAAERAVAADAGRLRGIAGITGVSVPPAGPGPQVARDGRSVVVAAAIRSDADSDVVAGDVLSAFTGDRDVRVGGRAVAAREFGTRIASDLGRAELFAFPLLFLLAIWIFRGVVAAVVPVAVGGIAVVTTMGVLRTVSTFATLSQYVLNLVIGLGLGLAIDYCLFVLSRYREEVAEHGYGLTAARLAAVRAGRTVLFSATTVALALASLMLFPQRFLYSMGVGGVVVTVVAALLAVTVVPAALALLGPRIDALAPARWRRAREIESGDVTAGWWWFIARMAMKHAPRVLAATLILVAVLALPAFSARFGDVDESSLPVSSPARQVSDALATQFPTVAATQVFLAVTAPADRASAVSALRSGVAGVPGVVPGTPRYLGRDTWQIDASVAGGAFDAATGTAVDRIRAVPSTVPFLVGGSAAAFVDLQSSLVDRLPWALGLVGFAVLVVMFLLTGSVVLSVKTLVLNVLNVAMTFGVLVWVFQYGHLEGLLGFSSIGRIDLTQPILMAIIAFGLSTDYGVFLFARITEAHDEGMRDVDAVAFGVGRSGRIISSAALLLCIAIGAFSTSSVLFIKQLGVGAAVAVFLDATVVRALLVPSAMKLMGSANWWAPGPLRRVHARFGIREGDRHPSGSMVLVVEGPDVGDPAAGDPDVGDPAARAFAAAARDARAPIVTAPDVRGKVVRAPNAAAARAPARHRASLDRDLARTGPTPRR